MSLKDPIGELLSDRDFLIIDGALATELESRGANLNDPLWSAKTLIEQPDLIYQVHLDYFKAGADVAITASYQATPLGLSKRGFTDSQSADLIRKSVELAQKARDEASHGNSRRLLVAGSVGPYGAYLADGSEYRGDYRLPIQEMKDFHRLRVKTLVEAGVDLLAIETIPSYEETLALLDLLGEFPDTTAWFSFTVAGEKHLADMTLLSIMSTLMNAYPQVTAVGVNCIRQDLVAGALKSLSTCQKPLLAYPNSGEVWDAENKVWTGVASGDDGSLHDQVVQWRAEGARLIGGCCKTSPKDIKIIRDTLSRLK